MLSTVLEFALVLGLMTGLAALMGKWLARVFTGTRHALPERFTYRLLGIDPRETMGWARYGSALLLANAAMMLLGYLVLRLQAVMPINPLGDLHPHIGTNVGMWAFYWTIGFLARLTLTVLAMLAA